VGRVPPIFGVGILILEALEAVYPAVESIYGRFFETDEDSEGEQRSGVDEM